jgi:osmoprotectant transport system substrate-binding protein
VTGFQNVAPIVKTSVARALGSTFTSTVNAVSAKLTLPAIVAMNKAFYVDKQSAASIAKAFLKANNLS